MYLTAAEIQRFNAAADSYIEEASQRSVAQRSVAAIRLLALTGARRGEVLTAGWEQFNLEVGTWTKPSSHTKQKCTHRVPLSPAAVELLLKIQAEGEHPSGYVFPAKGGSSGHMTDLKKAWKTIRCVAALPGVRLHDLRHTDASILASDGRSLPIIGALLGHTQASTTQRYTHPLTIHSGRRTGKVGKAFETRGGIGSPEPALLRTVASEILSARIPVLGRSIGHLHGYFAVPARIGRRRRQV